MELVDRLLAILAGPNPGHASRQLMAAGYSEDGSEEPGISPDRRVHRIDRVGSGPVDGRG